MGRGDLAQQRQKAGQRVFGGEAARFEALTQEFGEVTHGACVAASVFASSVSASLSSLANPFLPTDNPFSTSSAKRSFRFNRRDSTSAAASATSPRSRSTVA